MLRAVGFSVPHALGQLPFSAVLIVFGNFLGKTTKNFWLGIRTPWTLANDEVWLTHRLAGVLLMGAGFVHLATALTGASNIPFLIVLFLALVTAVIASYVFYRRIHPAKD
ncbi:MAG: SdpI family protein [Deltaproteobacteria bacterium]